MLPSKYLVLAAGNSQTNATIEGLLNCSCIFSSKSRADELETALMEMVKQDNRRELSAKVSIELLFSIAVAFFIPSPVII